MRRTSPGALALPATAVVVALWIVIACGLAGSPAAPTSTPAAAASPVATASPSLQTTPATAPPTTPSTASAPPSTAASPAGAQPPTGQLRAATQGKVGLLGSYCWHGSGPAICADYPAFTERESELPQITQTTATDHMVFLLDGGYPFASWSASYIDSSGATVPLGSGGGSFDPDAANQSITPTVSAAFPPPPDSGAWIVQVQVRFVEGGDAVYGWKVTVP